MNPLDPAFFVPAVGQQLASNYTGSRSVVGPDPNTMKRQDSVMMSPNTFRSTFDQSYQQQNPAFAALDKYHNRYQPNVQLGYRMGEEVGRPLLQNGTRGLNSLFASGVFPSAAMSATGLGGLALLGSLGYNALPFKRKVSPQNMALLAAGLGGLGGALGAHTANAARRGSPLPYKKQEYFTPEEYYAGVNSVMGKRASFIGSYSSPWRTSVAGTSYGQEFAQRDDAKNKIVDIIYQISSMTQHEKGEMINAVEKLSAHDLSTLANRLTTVGAIGAGALIANFLMGKGLLPTLLGAAAGAVGRSLFSRRVPRPSTFFNQPLGTFS